MNSKWFTVGLGFLVGYILLRWLTLGIREDSWWLVLSLISRSVMDICAIVAAICFSMSWWVNAERFLAAHKRSLIAGLIIGAVVISVLGLMRWIFYRSHEHGQPVQETPLVFIVDAGLTVVMWLSAVLVAGGIISGLANARGASSHAKSS